eukprot:CCRYP_000831-RA/>CCRYP_000831-RA protein AED:0.02 eAED:0.02 QI:2831/1/1/1/1/1/2/184/250
MRMRGVTNSIGNQIVHVRIGRLKIHLQAQCQRSFFMQTQFHLLEQFQIPLHGSFTIPPRQNIAAGNGRLKIRILPHRPRGTPPLRQITLRLHLSLGHITHIGQPLLDQLDRQLVQRLKVIRRVRRTFRLPPQPRQIPPKRIDILRTFGIGIGIVVSENGPALLHGHAEFFEGQAEIHVHAFRVPNVEVAVGFRGKAGADDAFVDGGVFFEESGGVDGPFEFARGEGVVGRWRGGFGGHGVVVCGRSGNSA